MDLVTVGMRGFGCMNCYMIWSCVGCAIARVKQDMDRE